MNGIFALYSENMVTGQYEVCITGDSYDELEEFLQSVSVDPYYQDGLQRYFKPNTPLYNFNPRYQIKEVFQTYYTTPKEDIFVPRFILKNSSGLMYEEGYTFCDIKLFLKYIDQEYENLSEKYIIPEKDDPRFINKCLTLLHIKGEVERNFQLTFLEDIYGKPSVKSFNDGVFINNFENVIILYLNSMLIETMNPVLIGRSHVEIIKYLNSQLSDDPYLENGHYKVFKKGSPLEFYKSFYPCGKIPLNIHEIEKLYPTVSEHFKFVRKDYFGNIDHIPTIEHFDSK